MKNKMRKGLCIAGLTVLSIMIAFGLYALLSQAEWKSQYQITVVEPTCTENGYSLYKHRIRQTTEVKDIIPAVGHIFGEKELIREKTDVECGLSRQICEVCGYEETVTDYPEAQIARLRLYGSMEGIGKTETVSMTGFVTVDGFVGEPCYVTLKQQGHSSLNYPKTNYTLKFYTDETHSDYRNESLFGWNKEHKYILKANYLDLSQCRNLVCADIWADMVAVRENVPERLRETSNSGAVDGVPIAVYLNDDFFGLFNFNLHKDDDLYEMKDDRRDAVVICNDSEHPEAFFAAEPTFEDSWELEFTGCEEEEWAQEKFCEFSEAVRANDFSDSIGDYMDTDAAVDYLIAMYTLGLTTSGAKDLTFICYDDGLWTPTLYDMENAFGFDEKNGKFISPEDFLPEWTGDGWNSGTGSVLWDKMLNSFGVEISARYEELRKSVLSEENIEKRVKEITYSVPSVYYGADESLYPRRAGSSQESIEQILSYIQQRFQYLDNAMIKLKEEAIP